MPRKDIERRAGVQQEKEFTYRSCRGPSGGGTRWSRPPNVDTQNLTGTLHAACNTAAFFAVGRPSLVPARLALCWGSSFVDWLALLLGPQHEARRSAFHVLTTPSVKVAGVPRHTLETVRRVYEQAHAPKAPARQRPPELAHGARAAQGRARRSSGASYAIERRSRRHWTQASRERPETAPLTSRPSPASCCQTMAKGCRTSGRPQAPSTTSCL